MSYKIYKIENYIFIENNENNSLDDYPAKDIRIDRPTVASDNYRIFHKGESLSIFGTDGYINISEIQDETGTPYSKASFEIFYLVETGFNPASGGSDAGFMDYNDTTGDVILISNTWTDIPNNGAGAFTNKTYKPEGVTEFIDVSTGYINVNDTELGETILIRNDYKVNPNTNNALLEFRYELGTGGGIYTLEKIVGRLDSGSGQYYRFSLEPDLIYMGDNNTKDNHIKLQLRLSTNGILTNAGSAITLVKR